MISTSRASDELNNHKAPEEAKLFVYDVEEARIVREIVPLPKGRATGLITEVATGRLLGLTVDTVNPRKPGSAVIYGLDVTTGEVLFRKTLPSALTSDSYWPHWKENTMTERDLPKNINPRAIFGDFVEPDWNQRLTITVGIREADLVGTSDRMIQAAVDYVARRGGGTVRVLPGIYRLRNSIFLQSNVRLLGSGTDSVLFKEPSVTAKLIMDGDHWDQEVTLADPEGFQVGDGVRLVSKDPYGKGTNIIQRTLVAFSGNRFI